MKRRIITIAFLCALLSGCASVTWKTNQGEELTYRRVGSTNMQGLELEKTGTGKIKVKMEKNKVDFEELVSIAQIMSQARPPVTP